jgi:A/G-specific adenine glycosylase
VRELCGAAQSGRPEDFPAARPRAAPRETRGLAGVLRSGGRVLLLRRPSRGLLGGLWELPSGDSPDALLAELAQRTGLRARAGAELGRVRHVFTHRALSLVVIELERRGGRRRGAAGESRWCTRAEIAELPLSRLMHKALALLHAGGSGSPGL